MNFHLTYLWSSPVSHYKMFLPHRKESGIVIPTTISSQHDHILCSALVDTGSLQLPHSVRRYNVNLSFRPYHSSHFSYSWVWIFHSRGENSKINRIHERCLRIIYNDKKSTFYELLEKYGYISIHKRNLRFLTCEMFKLKRDIDLELIKELILPNRQRRYELRNNPDFAVPIVKSVHKGLESLSYLGPKIWELLPLEIKETETFSQFKTKIKKWNPQNCPCRLCKIYLQNAGFI